MLSALFDYCSMLMTGCWVGDPWPLVCLGLRKAEGETKEPGFDR